MSLPGWQTVAMVFPLGPGGRVIHLARHGTGWRYRFFHLFNGADPWIDAGTDLEDAKREALGAAMDRGLL